MGRESGLLRTPVDSFVFLVPRISHLGLRFPHSASEPLNFSLLSSPTYSFPHSFSYGRCPSSSQVPGLPRSLLPLTETSDPIISLTMGHSTTDRRPRLFVGDITECCCSLPYVPGPSSLVAVGSQEEVESCPQPHPLAKVFRKSFRCQMPETQDSRSGFPR